MATKKKKNKRTGSKKRAKSKSAASKKAIAKKRPVKKKAVSKKPAAKAVKAKSVKAKAVAKKTSAAKSGRVTRRRSPGRSRRQTDAPFRRPGSESDSAGQSGDLQGLSDVESADSESVDELIDEGNAFEAGVVSGVEEADNEDGREVHTHEVPEDDVPAEYLDED